MYYLIIFLLVFHFNSMQFGHLQRLQDFGTVQDVSPRSMDVFFDMVSCV